MPGPVFLDGETVQLRTVERADLEFVRRTVSDPSVWRTLDRTRPMNGPASEQWFEERSGDDDVLDLLIAAGGSPAGLVSLHRRNHAWGLSSLSFWVAPDHQGEGYATEAVGLVIGHAFDQWRQRKLIAHVFEGNEPSCRLLETHGFEREGVHREEAYVDGEYRDLYTYGLLAADA